MKASTILIAFALIVAVSTAQMTNTTVNQNATGVNCAVDKAACSKLNPFFCCANIVRYINSTYNNVTQQCVNQTIANRTVTYNWPVVAGNATCIVSTETPNSSVFVKLSVAVASLGFLSLFL